MRRASRRARRGLQANHDAYRLLSEVETSLDEKLKEVRRLRMDMTNEAE